jgi:hypothetical protein
LLYRKRLEAVGGWRLAVSKKGASRRSGRSTLITAIGFALACSSASAANWEIAPRVAAGYRYNDNYRLEQPGGEIEVSGAEADAAVTFRNIDPRTRIEVTPRIRSTYFPDESSQDSTDYFLGALLHDETPRRRIGITADFEEEDVVRSELPNTEIDGDLGQPDVGDSGVLVERNRRQLISVAPYWEYDLTQRYSLELEARYRDATYERVIAGFNQDFSEAVLAAGTGIRLSPRSTIRLRGTLAQYETSVDADAYGAQVVWGTDFSPTSHFYISVGGQETKPDLGESDTNITAGIGGRWQTLRNRLFLDLTRDVGPVSAGTIVERHQLRFRLNHDISERFVTILGARLNRDEPIDDASTYPTREYATADVGLEWRFQRQFALTATYTYRWQEYSDELSDASANGFLIGIVYEPRRAD